MGLVASTGVWDVWDTPGGEAADHAGLLPRDWHSGLTPCWPSRKKHSEGATACRPTDVASAARHHTDGGEGDTLGDRNRVKLLFGPYTAPPHKRGDRATCLFRDCTVVITAWTDALIPWPRCRALDARGGGSGLLVDEELARAVRHESAAAIKYWWGASTTAVWAWRRALGVTRRENEGTARLVQTAAQKGAEAVKTLDWSAEEREARGRRAVELGLAKNLLTGYHGPQWTPEDFALLGTIPDEEVARRTGRTAGAVRQKLEELRIPNPAGNRWRPEEAALLGTLPDREFARRLGRSLQSVTQKRFKLGIGNPFDSRHGRIPTRRRQRRPQTGG
jgi:hypothetical protein